ncbi:hypothetical protein KCU89_g16354, partial [Aureobasidium melanogenum]
LRNARDAYETPDDKLNKEDDYIEIEDDSDTNALYAIILGHEEMDFDEIEEQILEVESYSGVDYYPYGDPSKRNCKTYSSRDSHVVTHRSTNLPFNCLCMAERTGCPVFS